MLIFHDGTSNYKNSAPDLAGSVLSPGVCWIDILEGTADEISFVQRVTGHHVPALEELREIENSSRLRFEDGVFCLSTPLVSRNASGMPQLTPVGFILTKSILVTIRFTALTAFSTFAEEYTKRDAVYNGGIGAFVGLIDAIIDRVADVLEGVGGDLDAISQGVFGGSTEATSEIRRPAKETSNLRETLRRIGRNGDLSSKIRDSLLGLDRIVSYVAGMGPEWVSTGLRAHLETQRHDVASLSDYDSHLGNKVQLLLDATMGLINIEQNNIIKVLTIVSVVGVPPTLVASMYGMNFRHMPELDWAWGYPYGLALIVLSAIAPLAWFKIRGWL